MKCVDIIKGINIDNNTFYDDYYIYNKATILNKQPIRLLIRAEYTPQLVRSLSLTLIILAHQSPLPALDLNLSKQQERTAPKVLLLVHPAIPGDSTAGIQQHQSRSFWSSLQRIATVSIVSFKQSKRAKNTQKWNMKQIHLQFTQKLMSEKQELFCRRLKTNRKMERSGSDGLLLEGLQPVINRQKRRSLLKDQKSQIGHTEGWSDKQSRINCFSSGTRKETLWSWSTDSNSFPVNIYR